MIEQDTGIPDLTNPPPSATEEQKIEAATAVQRETNVARSPARRRHPGRDVGVDSRRTRRSRADCSDTTGIPPPTCTDDASNRAGSRCVRRSGRPTPSTSRAPIAILTAPLDGTTHGMVDGMNPVNLAPVGGAQFFVDELDGSTLRVYWQYDDANGDGMPDYPTGTPPAAEPGTLLLFGSADDADPRRHPRPHDEPDCAEPLTADLAIFANLDEDDVHF